MPCGASGGCRPSSRTSPRSSTGRCASSGSSWPGVWTQGTVRDAERSLEELARLAETAGSEVLEGVIQRRDTPDPATYLGSGKARELRDIVVETGADTVICDGELTPGQLRQLEEIVKVKVVDRTWLILDIFAQHARSREGKAQVSLAQMQYLLPRLRGWGESLSRQGGGAGGGAGGGGGGGVGTRGPGETKIETDRRRIRTQMSKLRRQLKEMEASRTTQRAARHRAGIPAVAIAGYTNAGKSSLLNRITGAGVLVENALFATLDPTVRKTRTPSGRDYTLADTVGFVRHLPHQLVEAFRSTLEEVRDADLILHVVDGSDDAPEEQINAVREVLNEIDAGQVPELIVINKADLADPETISALLRREPHAVVVSARTGQGFEELLDAIEKDLPSRLVDLTDPGALLARRPPEPGAPAGRGAQRRPRGGRHAPARARARGAGERARGRGRCLSRTLSDALAAVVAAIGGEDRDGQLLMAQTVAAVARPAPGTRSCRPARAPASPSATSSRPRSMRHRRDGGAVIIATATLALQRQLVDRDLPRVAEAVAPLIGRPADVRRPQGPQQLRVPAEAARFRAGRRGRGAVRRARRAHSASRRSRCGRGPRRRRPAIATSTPTTSTRGCGAPSRWVGASAWGRAGAPSARSASRSSVGCSRRRPTSSSRTTRCSRSTRSRASRCCRSTTP